MNKIMTKEKVEKVEKKDDQLVEAEVTFAYEKDGSVFILVKLPDGNSDTLQISPQKYNKESKKFEDDKESFIEAKKLIESYGGDWDNPLSLQGKTIGVYYNGSKVSTKPIKKFYKKETLDPIEIRKLDKTIVETTPFSEWDGFAFQTYAIVPDEETGKEKYYKISNFKIFAKEKGEKDRTVKLSYQSDPIKELRGAVEKEMKKDESIRNQSLVDQLNEALDNLIPKERTEIIEGLNELFGQPIDEIIEEEVTFKVQLNGTSQGDFNFLSASLIED